MFIRDSTVLEYDDLTEAKAYLRDVGSPRPTSTCGLVVLRYFARLGCRCRETTEAYVPKVRKGHHGAIVDVQTLAQRHGAWMPAAARAALPEPGDVLGIEVGNPHVLVVTSIDGDLVSSIDGGQGDSTYTQRRVRRFVFQGGAASLADTKDGVSLRVGHQRAIYTRISGQRIAETPEKCG